MTKQKKEELVVAGSNLPAEVGESVLSYLDEKADEFYEPGFVVFQIGHQTGVFTAPGFGSVEGFIGVILAAELVRALWFSGTDAERKTAEGWTGGFPICSSRNNNGARGELPKALDKDTPDLVRAVIEPIINCDFQCQACQWNKFGSALRGRGKLCKESRRLLIWSPKTGVPGVLSVPPSSIANWRQYRAGMQGKHFSRVVTNFSLQQVTAGTNKYCVVNFSVAKDEDKNPMPVEPEMVVALGRQVSYGGRDMMEAEALMAEFLNLSIEREIDYPDNHVSAGTPAAAPEKEDEF